MSLHWSAPPQDERKIMPQRPQESLLLLCEPSRHKGKGDGSSILLKCIWQWQAGLVSSSVPTSEDPDPSRMLLSHPQLIHEHKTITAMFVGCTSTAVPMLQFQIPSLCGSVLTLVCIWIGTWISSRVFLYIVNPHISIKTFMYKFQNILHWEKTIPHWLIAQFLHVWYSVTACTRRWWSVVLSKIW